MAKHKVKGTVLQLEIASVYTNIGQLLSLNVGNKETETEETDTIDDATVDIEMEETGRASQEDTTGELFYDPTSAAHLFISDTIDTPAFPVNGKVIMPGPHTLSFEAAGFGIALKFAKADFAKADLKIKHAGVVSWPS